MTIDPAKTLLIGLLGLLPFLVRCQATTQASASFSPFAYDSVEIRWPKAEWFGKSRIVLGGYASARYRQGISSTSIRVLVNGREELMNKTPFRVEMQDSTGTKFTVRGEKLWSSGYWEEDTGGLHLAGDLLKLPEVITESETYMGDAVDLEIREAEMSHSLKPGDLWKFHLKRNRASGTIVHELDAYLSNGVRVIRIRGPIRSGISDSNTTGPEASYYEFVEDGKLIAQASRLEPKAYFPVHIPTFTRSLMLAAILAMGI